MAVQNPTHSRPAPRPDLSQPATREEIQEAFQSTMWDMEPEESKPDWAPPSPIVPVAVLAIFALVVVTALTRAESWDQVCDLLTVIGPIFTALLGLAIGYFVARLQR